MRTGTYYRYALFNTMRMFENVARGSEVLDVGGYDGFILSRLNAEKKVLIDPDASDIYDGIVYLREDFLEYDFKKQSFDFIYSFDVLEHIPAGKELDYLCRMVSLLKKDGELVMTTPSKNIVVFPSFLTGWVSKNWGHTKCIGYSKDEISLLLDEANIIKYEIYAYESRHYLNLYLFVRALQVILPEKWLENILTEIARRDAKWSEKVSKGYYLVKIRK